MNRHCTTGLVRGFRCRNLKFFFVKGAMKAWAAMTDIWHIVVTIQITFAIGIVKPDIFPANDVYGIVIEHGCVLAELSGFQIIDS